MAEAAVARNLQLFQVAGLEFSAKRWGRRGGIPLIALHGWLDNCASFDFLAPLLESFDVVCLDSAGHGRSGHRTHLGAYNIWQDVAEVFAVAEQLGWDKFDLLGHSRGAMVALLCAGTFPSRIAHLLMIEGACPRLAEPEEAASNLAKSIRFVTACMQRPATLYPSFSEAVAARQGGMFPLAYVDALALAEHGVYTTGDGFYWNYDSKVMAGSEIKLGAAQVDSFCHRISAECLLIVATEGALANDSTMQRWLARQSHWSIAHLPGGHHLHMSQQCREVANAIHGFY